MLEENDSRDQLWAGSGIFLRVSRNRSSVRHNSFLWSLAPLSAYRLVVFPYQSVAGTMKFLSTEYCNRLISNRCDCVGHVHGNGHVPLGVHVPLDVHVPSVRDDPLSEIRSNCG